MRRTIFAACFVALGCSGTKDPKIPGDELGTYSVVASLSSSTCGPGALGAKDLWEFEVKLSQDGHDLYWLNGAEAIPGDIAGDGVSFGFDSHVVVPVIEPGKGQPGCAIARTDSGSGKLSSAAPPVDAFTGTLRYGFSAVAGSDCQPVLAVEGGFHALPCEMAYSMTAARQPE
jgi:hypothetical protein